MPDYSRPDLQPSHGQVMVLSQTKHSFADERLPIRRHQWSPSKLELRQGECAQQESRVKEGLARITERKELVQVQQLHHPWEQSTIKRAMQAGESMAS